MFVPRSSKHGVVDDALYHACVMLLALLCSLISSVTSTCIIVLSSMQFLYGFFQRTTFITMIVSLSLLFVRSLSGDQTQQRTKDEVDLTLGVEEYGMIASRCSGLIWLPLAESESKARWGSELMSWSDVDPIC